jgi:hypothetical protein
MTLAFILLLSISSAVCALPLEATTQAGQSVQPAAPASSPAAGSSAQDQGNGAQGQSAPVPSNPTPAKTPAGQKPASAKRRRHKKKAIPANCNNAPATGTTSPAPVDPAAAGSMPAHDAQSVPTNCPPSKIIVRQGGTSEPSIQLQGGAASDQAAHQRDTANLLGSTEANLKKLAGRQLSANQQDMVSQVRQFMDQSKTATAAGDLERARTLAWMAQLLSEELAKPEK